MRGGLGYLACVEGFRVRFALAADLVNDLVAAQARNTLNKRLAVSASYDLLLIDELGYLSFDSRGADLLRCRDAECGATTRAALPAGVPTGQFGPRVQALVGVLGGMYRLPKRANRGLLADVFGISIGCGSFMTTLRRG